MHTWSRTSRRRRPRATRRTDSRSPANRQSYSILDTKGRAIESGVTGIDPVRMSYDTRGRLISVAQGTGGDERTTTFSYNAAGYLASATDALGQSGSLSYDPAGRVLVQTLANGSVIDFAYDANGNLISLTPPGKPAKLGVWVATPAVPLSGEAVQQWMCATVVNPIRSANDASTRIVIRSKSIVTRVHPVPADAFGGDSAAPDRSV